MTVFKSSNISVEIRNGKVDIGDVGVKFYTQDINTTLLNIRVLKDEQFLNFNDEQYKPFINLFMGDGSVFLDQPVEISDAENGLLTYKLADKVKHAGWVKFKLILKKEDESLHAANFKLEILDSGLESEIGRVIDVDILMNAFERFALKYPEKIRGKAFTYDDFTEEQLALLKGPKGDKGEPGADGKDGADGKSAYEVALANGFKGSEAEWVASLKGKDGINIVPDGSITSDKLGYKSVIAEKTNFLKVSTNLIDKNKYIFGQKLDTSNGELIPSSVIFVMEKVYDVVPDETYTSNNLNARCFYDKDGKFVSGSIGNGTFTIPKGVYKMKVAVSKTALETAQLNRGNVLLSYEPYFKPSLSEEFNPLTKGVISHEHLQLQSIHRDNLSFFVSPENMIHVDRLKEGVTISAATGEETPNTTVASSDFEKIHANKDYTISKVSRVLFYDINKKYLGLFHEAQLDTKTYTTPASAYYQRYVIYKSNYGTAQMNEGSSLLPYKPYEEPYLDVRVRRALEVDKSMLDKFMFDLPVDRRYETAAVFGDYKEQSKSTSSDMYQLFDDLYSQYPQYFKEKKLLGNDDFGNPITYYYVSTKQPTTTVTTKRPLYLITCGTHGFEKISTAIVYETFKNAFANWKTDEGLETLLFNADFIIVPVVNPSGWNAFTRINGNGVDLNRNFGTKDWSSGNKETTTYGGTAPFSEKESQYIKYLFDNFKFDSVIDFHNFHSNPDNNHVWIVAEDEHQLVAQKTINRLFRQWKKKYDFIPQDSILGFTSKQAGGLLANYGFERGVKLACTFEVCWKWLIDPKSENYDEIAMRTGVETFVNHILMQFQYFDKL